MKARDNTLLHKGSITVKQNLSYGDRYAAGCPTQQIRIEPPTNALVIDSLHMLPNIGNALNKTLKAEAVHSWMDCPAVFRIAIFGSVSLHCCRPGYRVLALRSVELHFGIAHLWVPIIRLWVLTKGYALHPWAPYVASFSGSSRCWHGLRYVVGTRRTSRLSSYGTNSACCAAAATDRS